MCATSRPSSWLPFFFLASLLLPASIMADDLVIPSTPSRSRDLNEIFNSIDSIASELEDISNLTEEQQKQLLDTLKVVQEELKAASVSLEARGTSLSGLEEYLNRCDQLVKNLERRLKFFRLVSIVTSVSSVVLLILLLAL